MTHDDSPRDVWESGSAYERFMGRWSRELARDFVSWLGPPPDGDWLEVGCGTGALTSAILDLGRPASLLATDASEPFVAHTRSSLPDPRLRCLTATAEDLPTTPGGFDVVASSLVLNFLPEPVAALWEMKARTAGGGVVAACVWDYAGGMDFLRRFWDAAVALDPSAREYDEGERFPICSPSALETAFREAGFTHVETEALEVKTPFEDFEDFWSPFVGGPGPAPGYLASLPTSRRRELESRLEATLPRSGDGSISLTARAWAVRGDVHEGGGAVRDEREEPGVVP